MNADIYKEIKRDVSKVLKLNCYFVYFVLSGGHCF
jgi:hypothetical protein